MDERGTIAAISTAPGKSGVAVVRMSGADAFRIAERLSGSAPRACGFRLVDLKVDKALMLGFKSPASYTGEDVVEFQCHGGAVTPRRVLELCLKAGARLARRGEFTERALLNGKLDYERAEATIDLIEAKTERAADAALAGLSGEDARECKAFYERTLAISSAVEHALDVDEGELPNAFVGEREAEIAGLKRDLDATIKRLKAKRILRDGALVVIAGAPNAGKSSLMNALLEENRAIVSPEPGTTRDFVEAWLDLDGWPVRLVDTAGLRETDSAIEAEGVKRAEALIAQADLVLALDCERGLRVHSKCDLGRGEGLNVSAKTGEGLSELKAAIIGELEKLDFADDSPRLSALVEARAALPEACADLVLAGNRLRQAAEILASALGLDYSSDLLDKLFFRFCVGK